MLNSENVHEDGIYLLENGEDCLIYVGNMVNLATLEQIFGVSSVAALPVQASLFLSRCIGFITLLYFQNLMGYLSVQ